ncbi:hypothetical protein [Labedaea rhizosphaerae]|uniref:Uncharacterized protein n=1 Tax=Labedaea rhizosphaerae TaxID=598644 RepID=A0A4R6SMW7_LABRH|nr:hypothetical protein [Labedaea rhizosphaerae]TDQ05866.1 hypothetical protein EV186_1011844 [Labedaea rhizosphaerae]
MNSPTRTPAERGSAAARASAAKGEPHGLAAAPARLKAALGLSLLAAVTAAIALPLGVLRAAPHAGFSSGPLLFVLALLPTAVAVGLVAANRHLTGARVLVGAAVLAPGALLTDLQLVVDATRVARPEIVMPTSLTSLDAGLGAWLLLAAHVLTVAAGLCAVGYAGAAADSAFAEAVDNPDRPRSLTQARRLLGASLGCGVIIAVGSVLPALYSHDALLVAVDIVPSPWLVRVGSVLVAVAAVVALPWAAGTGNPAVHRGVSLGVLTAVAAVSVPPLAAGLVMARVGVAPGPILALVGAALAVGAALIPAKAEDADEAEDEHEAEITLGGNRLHKTAGVLGVLLGVGAVISAVTAVYVASVVGDSPAPAIVGAPTKLGLAAGVLVGVLGLVVATGGRAAQTARPAFVVALGALALPAAATLDDALGATRARDSIQGQSVPGADSWMTVLLQGQSGPAAEQVTLGAAFWLSVLLLVGAAIAAVVAGLAGVAEREELDLSDRPDNQVLWAPAGLAAVAAIGAFALPLVNAPNYRIPDLYSTFTVASAGQLLALIAVVAAVLQAPLARPARGAALLIGAAGVVGVRLLQFPLGSSRVPGASTGPGWWLALLTLALLVVAAAVAGSAEPEKRTR